MEWEAAVNFLRSKGEYCSRKSKNIFSSITQYLPQIKLEWYSKDSFDNHWDCSLNWNFTLALSPSAQWRHLVRRMYNIKLLSHRKHWISGRNKYLLIFSGKLLLWESSEIRQYIEWAGKVCITYAFVFFFQGLIPLLMTPKSQGIVSVIITTTTTTIWQSCTHTKHCLFCHRDWRV